MSEADIYGDSHKGLVAVLQVLDPAGNVIGDLPIHNYLQGLEVSEASDKAWTASLMLYDQDGGFLEDSILGTVSGDQPVRFCFGWGTALSDFPWFSGIIVRIIPTMMVDGIIMKMEIVAKDVSNAAANPIQMGWPEGTPLHQIIMDIATKAGWQITSPGELGAIPLVEETKTRISRGMALERNMSPLKFIRERLLQLAVSAKSGQSDYAFYLDRHNRIHFHSRDYLRKYGALTHTFTFGRTHMGRIISFEPSDNSVFTVIYGASNAEFRGSLAMAASIKSIRTTTNQDAQGNAPSAPADSTGRNDPVEGVPNIRYLIGRDEETIAAIAQHKYDALRNITYTAKLSMIGTHAILPGDYIQITYLRRDGKPHLMSGTFRVASLKHDVRKGSWVTEFELHRPGLSAGTSRTTGPTTTAPKAKQ